MGHPCRSWHGCCYYKVGSGALRSRGCRGEAKVVSSGMCFVRTTTGSVAVVLASGASRTAPVRWRSWLPRCSSEGHRCRVGNIWRFGKRLGLALGCCDEVKGSDMAALMLVTNRLKATPAKHEGPRLQPGCTAPIYPLKALVPEKLWYASNPPRSVTLSPPAHFVGFPRWPLGRSR